MLGLFMKENSLIPADIMRAMVVILNPKEEEILSCPIGIPKNKSEKVLELNECAT